MFKDKFGPNFCLVKFSKIRDEAIPKVPRHSLEHSLKNAYRYIDFLHSKFGEPLTKREISFRIKEGMRLAREKGRHTGRFPDHEKQVSLGAKMELEICKKCRNITSPKFMRCPYCLNSQEKGEESIDGPSKTDKQDQLSGVGT